MGEKQYVCYNMRYNRRRLNSYSSCIWHLEPGTKNNVFGTRYLVYKCIAMKFQAVTTVSREKYNLTTTFKAFVEAISSQEIYGIKKPSSDATEDTTRVQTQMREHKSKYFGGNSVFFAGKLFSINPHIMKLISIPGGNKQVGIKWYLQNYFTFWKNLYLLVNYWPSTMQLISIPEYAIWGEHAKESWSSADHHQLTPDRY